MSTEKRLKKCRKKKISLQQGGGRIESTSSIEVVS